MPPAAPVTRAIPPTGRSCCCGLRVMSTPISDSTMSDPRTWRQWRGPPSQQEQGPRSHPTCDEGMSAFQLSSYPCRGHPSHPMKLRPRWPTGLPKSSTANGSPAVHTRSADNRRSHHGPPIEPSVIRAADWAKPLTGNTRSDAVAMPS